MFELEDFGGFLTCKGVIDEEDTRPLSEEVGILAGFCACQDPLPKTSDRSLLDQERHDMEVNSLVMPSPANGSVVLTQSVTRDDGSSFSGEANEVDDHSVSNNSKVMVVVVRRDRTNKSVGVGMIP